LGCAAIKGELSELLAYSEEKEEEEEEAAAGKDKKDD
jgi:hypothetical protein